MPDVKLVNIQSFKGKLSTGFTSDVEVDGVKVGRATDTGGGKGVFIEVPYEVSEMVKAHICIIALTDKKSAMAKKYFS